MLADSDLSEFFKNIRKHLKPGGLFIFDTWNGPAAKRQELLPKSKVIQSDNLKISRLSMLTHIQDKNQVSLDYTLIVENPENISKEQYQENHTVRYLFPEEIRKLAADNSFQIKRTSAWLETRDASENDWNVCWVLKAI